MGQMHLPFVLVDVDDNSKWYFGGQKFYFIHEILIKSTKKHSIGKKYLYVISLIDLDTYIKYKWKFYLKTRKCGSFTIPTCKLKLKIVNTFGRIYHSIHEFSSIIFNLRDFLMFLLSGH